MIEKKCFANQRQVSFYPNRKYKVCNLFISNTQTFDKDKNI